MIDAFKIGIMLSMSTNATQILNHLSREFLGLHGHINATQAALIRTRTIIAGMATMTIGVGLIEGFKSLFQHGEELRNQQVLLQGAILRTRDAMGQPLPQAKIEEMSQAAKDRAFEVTRLVPGTVWAENLRDLNDMRQVLGSLDEAIQLLPDFEKNAQLLKDVGGYVSQAGGGAQFMTSRLFEMRGNLFDKNGQLDQNELTKELNALSQVEINTQGRIDPSRFVKFMQQARGAGITLSDEALFYKLPAVMMAMNADRAGTGFQALWKAIGLGLMTPAATDEAIKLGMLTKGEKGDNTLKANLMGGDLVGEDPVSWVETVLFPHMKAVGLDTGDKNVVARTIALLLSNRSAAGFVTDAAFNLANIRKEETNIRNAGGLETSDFFGVKLPSQIVRQFTSAWTNLMQALGDPSIDAGVVVLKSLTWVINQLAYVAKNFPHLVAFGEIVMGLVGVLSVLGGAFLIIRTGLSPLISGLMLISSYALPSARVAFAYVAQAAVLARTQIMSLLAALSRLIPSLGSLVAFFSKISGILSFLYFMKPGTTNGGWDYNTNQSGERDKLQLRGLLPSQTPPSSQPKAKKSATNEDYHQLVVHVNTHLDGAVVAKQTIKKLVMAMNGPVGGQDSFDSTRHYTPV